MAAYYNEIDPYAAQWLRHLIAMDHIADGEVDERSIVDVRPEELRGFTQCHFFAGIGVWSYALRRAGWRDDRPVWTGSCPCQPFSAAGKRGGNADERHLWPHWFHLIEHGKPRGVPVFGEQVASKDGLAWLDLVHADLEGQGYTVGAVDLCAAGVGAPHIRQRLFFVADTDEGRSGRDAGAVSRTQGSAEREVRRVVNGAESRGAVGIVADSAHERVDGRRGAGTGRRSESSDRSIVGYADDARSQGRSVSGAVGERDGASERAARATGAAGRIVADADGRDASAEGLQRSRQHGLEPQDGRTRSFWSDCDWLPCIDGKARPVEPGTFPLAHGVAARVGRLRAYGNAIVAPLAEEFIRAYIEVTS